VYKNATKCNETIGKWCKTKHGASKIIDTFETYQRELAHSYVDYADTDAFVRDIREPEKKDDAGASADAEGSDSSQDDEEVEEADTDAPEQASVPGRGDGSIPSAGSGTPEADISTATAPPAGGSASAAAP
jgi:hypothetical protein